MVISARFRVLIWLPAALLMALPMASQTDELKEPVSPTHPWSDPQLSPDDRARMVLAAATPEERLALLHGPMPALIPAAKRPPDMLVAAGYIAGIPRLGIPALIESDGGLGVANLANMRRNDTATALPSGTAAAATWDPMLVERSGAMIGSEARAKGFNVLLGGSVNLLREPRNGRGFEYFGEDPLLAGKLAGRSIKGIQSNGIISTIKHFALNDQETGRNVHSVNMSEQAMQESDLLTFKIAMEQGDPGAVMCAYNKVNGVYACENDMLLNRVLRDTWGYKGWVMSDWGAVHSTEALLKGLDQQSGEQVDGKPYFSSMLQEALAKGTIPQSAVDRAALRILRTMFAHGLVDRSVRPAGTIDHAANAAIAQEVAEAGIVLLRNRGNLLPVPTATKRIAVIGGHADIGVLSGGGSSQVRPMGGPALELRPPRGNVVSTFSSITYVPSSPLAALRKELPASDISFHDGQDVAAAVAAAHDADLVIVFAEKWQTEAADPADLALTGNQDALIAAVAKANPKTVVVLETAGPVTMPWIEDVGAVLAAWYPGQRGGEAIARVVSGAVNPSGHLPVTFPASLDQLPNPKLAGIDLPPLEAAERAVYGVMATSKPFDVTYPEGADTGYRWYDTRKLEPLFAFGHGLSYTRFTYKNLEVEGARDLKVSFDITNSGSREGADVAQVYVRGKGTRRLVGWERVTLKPGETRRVTIVAEPRMIASYDVGAGAWQLAKGTYTVEVSESAIEPKLTARTQITAKTLKP